ncbi:DNA polymerase delta subunit 4 [Actinomortierella ambigua]|nr:DNA polymerase delta subunit 4 [Actinomortierella ambigua]
MPPKRTPSSGATQVSASNFFQQVKKPTTAAHARTLTLKKNDQPALAPMHPMGRQPAMAKDKEDVAKGQKKKYEDEIDEIDEAEYDDDFSETTDDSSNTETADLKSKKHTAVIVQQVSDEILDDSDEDLALPGKGQRLLMSSDAEDEEDEDELATVEEEEEEEERLFDEIKPATAPAVKKANKQLRQKQQLQQHQQSWQAKSTRMRKDKPVAVPDMGDIHRGFHQNELSAVEKTLRQFDLAQKYGPCTDVTRLERWERAFALGMNPPREIKDVLLANPSLNKGLFSGRV